MEKWKKTNTVYGFEFGIYFEFDAWNLRFHRFGEMIQKNFLAAALFQVYSNLLSHL